MEFLNLWIGVIAFPIVCLKIQKIECKIYHAKQGVQEHSTPPKKILLHTSKLHSSLLANEKAEVKRNVSSVFNSVLHFLVRYSAIFPHISSLPTSRLAEFQQSTQLSRGGFFYVKRRVYMYEDLLQKMPIFKQINMPFWCKTACLSV